jgi:hypothetical protein
MPGCIGRGGEGRRGWREGGEEEEGGGGDRRPNPWFLIANCLKKVIYNI